VKPRHLQEGESALTDQISPLYSAIDQLARQYPKKPLLNALNDVFADVTARLKEVQGMPGVYTTAINPPITFIEIEEKAAT